jgi:hypothetical protein
MASRACGGLRLVEQGLDVALLRLKELEVAEVADVRLARGGDVTLHSS